MPASQMLDHALQYAGLGYSIFPCAPSRKTPATARGFLDASTDAEQIEAWWNESPAANLAIATAGLLVVDIDSIDGAGNPWLADQPEKLIDLAAGPLSLTPRGGRHYIFRQPAGADYRNTAGKLAPGVDTRANGGYILLPPSIVEGKPYRWPGEARLDNTPPEQLPEPPAWLLAMLDGLAANSRSNHRNEPAPRIEAAALDGTKPGDDFCLRASWSEILEPHGWKFAGATPDRVERWTRPGKNDGVSATTGHCRSDAGRDLFYVFSGNAAPFEAGRGYNKFSTFALLNHAGDFSAATIDIAGRGYGQAAPLIVFDSSEPIQPDAVDPGRFPESLLTVPGFIGDVVEYNLRFAQRTQPALALAAALALLATLTGRKIADPSDLRTNLYIIGVCNSGGGKEWARKVNKDILKLAGLEGMIAQEDIASATGIVSFVERHPACLFQIDEIGRFLKTLGNVQAAHLFKVPDVLMKLFSSANTTMRTACYADADKNKLLYQPHVCLYGTTVPKSLYEGFSGDSVTDGFMSRILIFVSDDQFPIENEDTEFEPPPRRILDVARFWGEFRPGGNLSPENPDPLIIRYTPEAKAAMRELGSLARREMMRGGDTATLWTRTVEKAKKLAMLYACSADPFRPHIDQAAATWAAGLSEFLTHKAVAIAQAWIAANPFEAKRKAVLRTIKAAGEAGLTTSELCRATRTLPKRERLEIMDSLEQAGEVQLAAIETATKPRTVYVAR